MARHGPRRLPFARSASHLCGRVRPVIPGKRAPGPTAAERSQVGPPRTFSPWVPYSRRSIFSTWCSCDTVFRVQLDHADANQFKKALLQRVNVATRLVFIVKVAAEKFQVKLLQLWPLVSLVHPGIAGPVALVEKRNFSPFGAGLFRANFHQALALYVVPDHFGAEHLVIEVHVMADQVHGLLQVLAKVLQRARQWHTVQHTGGRVEPVLDPELIDRDLPAVRFDQQLALA